MATGRGGRPDAATTSTTPSVAATTLRQYRGGSSARIQGTTQPAAANAYRIRPMASTHPPSEPAT
jgi:hypothetical protein